MKKFIKEFKEFIDQGNVIDLAVGVIIGGGADGKLGALQIQIIPGNEATVIEFGSFISSIISFIIMALIVFLIVKAVRKAATIGKKKKAAEEEKEPTTKVCPFCKSEIDIEATRCPHCTSELPEEEEEAE